MTRCRLCSWRGPSDLAVDHLIRRHLACPPALDERAEQLIRERVAACLSAGRSGLPRSPAMAGAAGGAGARPVGSAAPPLDLDDASDNEGSFTVVGGAHG